MTQGNDSNQAETTQRSVEANVQVHLTAILTALINAGLYLYQIQSHLTRRNANDSWTPASQIGEFVVFLGSISF